MLSQDSPDPDAGPAPAPDRSPSPSEDPRRTLGRLGENLAVAHFEKLGFSPLGRNERTRHGEIDLIAFDGYTLVFAEVKTRRVSAYKHGIRPDQQPLAWLHSRQSERLRQLAAA